jgi:hypothetical protein
MKLSTFLLFVLYFSFGHIYAQQTDSASFVQPENTIVVLDTGSNDSLLKPKLHSPKKAAWMSAVLPGLGQGYNKKYWKIPIVYAGFAGTTLGIVYYYMKYADYRDEYRNRLNNKPDLLQSKFANNGDDNIKALKLQQQQKMEIFILVTVVWYLVNIVDAVVDAHLLSFDISDDLSLNMMPSIGWNNQYTAACKTSPTTAITFSLHLKSYTK